MKLVENARDAWRWFSMHAMGAAVALLGAWQALPDEMQTLFPPKVVMGMAAALVVLGMVGRLVKQEPKP